MSAFLSVTVFPNLHQGHVVVGLVDDQDISVFAHMVQHAVLSGFQPKDAVYHYNGREITLGDLWEITAVEAPEDAKNEFWASTVPPLDPCRVVFGPYGSYEVKSVLPPSPRHGSRKNS